MGPVTLGRIWLLVASSSPQTKSNNTVLNRDPWVTVFMSPGLFGKLGQIDTVGHLAVVGLGTKNPNDEKVQNFLKKRVEVKKTRIQQTKQTTKIS